VGVRLSQAAYAHGLALALLEEIALARPTGVRPAISTNTIPIEGRDAWLAAARRLRMNADAAGHTLLDRACPG
jgi:hypothetical protein